MNGFVWGVLAIMGLASCAPAAAPARATPGAAPAAKSAAALKPPLDSLAFYVGTWRCKGTYYPTPEAPKQESWEARMEVEPELDGTWVSVRMIGPGPSRSIEHKGYDPATKRWVHVAVTNTMGSWGTVFSNGWNGSEMVFTSDDKNDTSVATFTKLGETAYSHVVMRKTDQGMVKDWEKHCTKM